MSNHPTPRRTRQPRGPCTGQDGGHVPPGRAESWFEIVTLPAFPDVSAGYRPAVIGTPCLGIITPEGPPDPAPHPPPFHVGRLFVSPAAALETLHPSGTPVPRIIATADQSGSAHGVLHNTDGITVEQMDRLSQAYHTILTHRITPGRPQWSGGYFTDEEDFKTALHEAMWGILTRDRGRTDPTQAEVLSWWADNRADHFSTCDERRLTEWCHRAQVQWRAFKAKIIAEFRAGFAQGHPDQDAVQ